MSNYQNIVERLQQLLQANPDWEKLLLDSIQEASQKAEEGLTEDLYEQYTVPKVATLKEYFHYLDWLVRWTPIQVKINPHPSAGNPSEQFNKEVLFQILRFYWILDQPSGLQLQKHDDFKDWMHDFANDWGSFLNTPESISEASIQSFIDDPDYKMFQYLMPAGAYTPLSPDAKSNNPAGWQSFNQFFAREINPGMRPVAGMFNDAVIVSPADSTFKSKYKITSDSRVTIKYTHTYNIAKLLEGSEYQDRFKNGLYMHSFLGPSDYHRFHTPVRGTVLESRAVQERVYLNVTMKNGEFHAPDEASDGYEFRQTRGIIILDSPVGLVAVIPIGMAQVSSVNMTAVVGAYLNKGDEFGYFMFGGSDIILLFEGDQGVTINAAPGIHYNVGMCIGEIT